MYTITAPEKPWGTPPPLATGRYTPTRSAGKRIPGWEDLNVTALAADVGVSFRYLLAVLRGQRNCTLALLQNTAQALGITTAALISRMENAYELHCLAAAKPVDKNRIRRLRSERRASMSPQ